MDDKTLQAFTDANQNPAAFDPYSNMDFIAPYNFQPEKLGVQTRSATRKQKNAMKARSGNQAKLFNISLINNIQKRYQPKKSQQPFIAPLDAQLPAYQATCNNQIGRAPRIGVSGPANKQPGLNDFGRGLDYS
jgi:hypothetical protein